MKSRTIRTLAVVATAGLLVGAFAAGPAEAKKKKKKKAPACATYMPQPPASPAEAASQVGEVPVITITDAATEEAPVTVELEQGEGLWGYDQDLHQFPIFDDTQFLNFQVDSAAPQTGLYVRQEWSNPSPSDLDLYLYDVSGTEIGGSGAFNPAPVPIISSQTGGMGYEQVSGMAMNDCAGTTAESRTYATHGETVTFKVWLGEIVAAE